MGLTLIPTLPFVLIGLALIGASTFFMQAAATGFVGRTATQNRAAANGLYLTFYYIGGLAGAFLLGWVNTISGWTGVALLVAGVIAVMIPLARILANPGPVVLPRAQMPKPDPNSEN